MPLMGKQMLSLSWPHTRKTSNHNVISYEYCVLESVMIVRPGLTPDFYGSLYNLKFCSTLMTILFSFVSSTSLYLSFPLKVDSK